MLETKLFTFDRHGVFTFLQKLTCFQFADAMKLCTAYARLKKTKKPCEWSFIPTLVAI